MVDRYWLSTHVYAQCRDSSLDLSGMVSELERPDMTVMLDLNDRTRQERMTDRGVITLADSESIKHQKELRELYNQAINLPITGDVLVLDTGKLLPAQCASLVTREIIKTLAA